MKRILIAEDDPASRELLNELLGADGYQVVLAVDGRDALAKLQEQTPDLMLMDIQMPELDGFEVLRRVRAQPQYATLPVVAFTAYAMSGDKEKALAAGFDGYITKPIRVSALREELKKFFR